MKLQAVVDSFKSSCRTSIWKKKTIVFSLHFFFQWEAEKSQGFFIFCVGHTYIRHFSLNS